MKQLNLIILSCLGFSFSEMFAPGNNVREICELLLQKDVSEITGTRMKVSPGTTTDNMKYKLTMPWMTETQDTVPRYRIDVDPGIDHERFRSRPNVILSIPQNTVPRLNLDDIIEIRPDFREIYDEGSMPRTNFITKQRNDIIANGCILGGSLWLVFWVGALGVTNPWLAIPGCIY